MLLIVDVAIILADAHVNTPTTADGGQVKVSAEAKSSDWLLLVRLL